MTESPHARFERFAPEERLFHVESLPEALRLPPTLLRMATTELGRDWRRALGVDFPLKGIVFTIAGPSGRVDPDPHGPALFLEAGCGFALE
jgi:hypothetical protein